jgi:hypothetical protein
MQHANTRVASAIAPVLPTRQPLPLMQLCASARARPEIRPQAAAAFRPIFLGPDGQRLDRHGAARIAICLR